MSGFRSNLSLLTGMALGAGVMYIADPQSGGRRRALVRDKINRGAHLAGRALWQQACDLRNRAWGAVAEKRAHMRESDIDDRTLEQRVRAQIGHVVTHAGAIQVEAREGCVVVSGPVLRGEGDKIRRRLEKTRGVRACEIRVEEHDSQAGIPGLQGLSRPERQWRSG